MHSVRLLPGDGVAPGAPRIVPWTRRGLALLAVLRTRRCMAALLSTAMLMSLLLLLESPHKMYRRMLLRPQQPRNDTLEWLDSLTRASLQRVSYAQQLWLDGSAVPRNATDVLPSTNYPENETSTLCDMKDFHYLIENPTVCGSPNEEIFLLILVHSAPKNKDRRSAVRATWGRRLPQTRTVFFVGSVAKTQQQRSLQDEAAEHGDLVQGSFPDHYFNLTYKHLLTFKWAATHCSRARYLAKVDDDGFLHLPAVLGTLRDLSPTGMRNLILCSWMVGSRVFRPPSRYQVPREAFAPDVFPKYCSGCFIIYSPDVAHRLYELSLRSVYIGVDDAFVSGILAEQAGIKHSDVLGLVKIYPKTYQDPRTVSMLAVYEVNEADLYSMWRHVTTEANDTALFSTTASPTSTVTAATTATPG